MPAMAAMAALRWAVMLLAAVAHAQPNGTKVAVRVQEQSGTVTAFRSALGESDPSKVSMTVDTVQEVDGKGKAVGSAEKPHALVARSVTIKPAEEAAVGTARTEKTSFTTPVGLAEEPVGRLQVETFLVTSPGKMGPWSASVGDIMWRVALSTWSWSGRAAGSTERRGSYVDVVVEFKGSGIKPATLVKGLTYDLGSGVRLELANKITLDGKEATMPAGYPKLHKKGGLYVFVIRFPSFVKSALYEPLLRMSGVVDASSSRKLSSRPQRADPVSAGGISVWASGRGGRFTAYALDDSRIDKNKVALAVEGLRELDSRGNLMGNGKHTVDSFVDQNFAINDVTQMNLGTARGNVLSLTAPAGSMGELTVDSYVLFKGGMVGPDADMLYAAVGDVKFHLQLSSWSWCGCWANGNPLKGAYVDLDFSVQGMRRKPVLIDAEKNTWDLGGGILMELTHMIELDGVDIDMPTGYPRFELKNGVPVFTVRVPKFKDRAVYEGLLRMSGSETLGDRRATFVSHGRGLAAPHAAAVALLAGGAAVAAALA